MCPPNELETFESQQVASDCLWSDPAKGDQARKIHKKQDDAGARSRRGGGSGGGTWGGGVMPRVS